MQKESRSMTSFPKKKNTLKPQQCLLSSFKLLLLMLYITIEIEREIEEKNMKTERVWEREGWKNKVEDISIDPSACISIMIRNTFKSSNLQYVITLFFFIFLFYTFLLSLAQPSLTNGITIINNISFFFYYIFLKTDKKMLLRFLCSSSVKESFFPFWHHHTVLLLLSSFVRSHRGSETRFFDFMINFNFFLCEKKAS